MSYRLEKSVLLSIITVDVVVVEVDDEVTVLPQSVLIDFVADVVETDVFCITPSISPGKVGAIEGTEVEGPPIDSNE